MRPEGWKNPHKLGKGKLGITDPCCVRVLRENSFEAGADAMLEGLKKQGMFEEVVYGYELTVFIPQDTDTKEETSQDIGEE